MVDFRAECERRQQHQKGGDEDENKSRGTRGEQNSFLAKEERRLVGINARGNKFHPLGRDWRWKNNRSNRELFVETVRVARGGGTLFGEASRGAHVEMHGGIRGLPVRRTVGGRDYERRRGEYCVRCRGEEARGALFFIRRDESVTREDEDATGVY